MMNNDEFNLIHFAFHGQSWCQYNQLNQFKYLFHSWYFIFKHLLFFIINNLILFEKTAWLFCNMIKNMSPLT